MKISKTTLLREIRDHDGNLLEIARAHGMTYYGVLKRIKEDPELSEALEDSREAVIDTAQSQLMLAVREGKTWAIKFVLETWGKSRGFGKQLEVVEAELKSNVVIYIPDNGRTRAPESPI